MTALFLAPLFFFAFLSLGWPAFRCLEARGSLAFRTCAALALGMGLFASLLAGLGHAGLLVPEGILILLCASLIPVLYDLQKNLQAAKEFIVYFLRGISSGSWAEKTLAISYLAVILFSFLFCFVPEAANDSLCYQLNIPKYFAWRGASIPDVNDFNTYFPMLFNQLYAAALSLGSVSLAKIFHFMAGLCLVTMLVERSEAATGQLAASKWAGLLLWLTPTFLNEVSTTYIDVAAALFLTASFFTLRESVSRQQNSILLFLSGILLGFSISTKVLVLIAAPAFFLFIGLESFRRISVPTFLKTLFIWGAGVFTGSCFWFLRNFMLTGNPAFPFLGKLFGTQEYDFVKHFQDMGPAKDLLHYVLLPVFMTFNPDGYDRGYWIGPFLLLFFPFFIRALIRFPETRSTGALVWAYVTVWFLFFHNVRFLLPVLPLIAFIGIQGAAPFFSRALSLRLLLAASLIFLALLGSYHQRYSARVLFGAWSSSQYLEFRERSWGISDWINRHLPAEAKIYNAEEIRQFYFSREMVRDAWFLKRYPGLAGETVEGAVSLLKREGFTHILRAKAFPENPAAEAGRFSHIDRVLGEKSKVKLVHQMISQNQREGRMLYELYEWV